MYLKSIELSGFKSFGKKTELVFGSRIAAIVGPNGSGKSNVAEGFRFVLGEQSMKSMRSKRGEDLIWGGSPALARMNRATVKVVFNNEPVHGKRLLDIDFSEVVVERIVHRDGANEYLLNGSQVRLKDVIRLLAGANIGGSGYQIISQGEADRILNASPRERREMVEDALGLKLYQHKKAESERKLEETGVNIDKTKSLRRELAPHLKFLQTQVEKIEKAREMKEELAHKLGEYLARENAWITAETVRVHDEIEELEKEIRSLEEKLRGARSTKGGGAEHSPLLQKVQTLQDALHEARKRREEIVRDLGRAEGAVEAAAITVEHVVPAPHVRDFVREITESIEEAERTPDVGGMRKLLSQLRGRIRAFVEGLSGAAPITNEEARKEVIRLTAALEKAEREEVRVAETLEEARGEIAKEREEAFRAEREEVQVGALLREAQSKMMSLKAEKEHVAEQKRRFEEEVREGIALLGPVFEGWNKREIPPGALSEERREQEKRRREIERYKIKIEEAGVGGGDAVIKEYNQTVERDSFLLKELTDLEHSARSLKDLITELERTIDSRFSEGLKHINEALGEFFQKLFGGGNAKLFVEEPRYVRREKGEDTDEEMQVPEEEELYAGLSIDVSLPRKKIRGLEVLSGGERALTSIALIFSMSQVNPPPFLILDETDAALDEANSKRYADMIMELGKKSQLIVITHNRATMAAAGELYGVTMSNDGVSKILSVKLEEAERVAK